MVCIEPNANLYQFDGRLTITGFEQQIELTQKQKELAQTIYDQTLLQQKQGLAALTEVLLADNAMRDAQQSHLNALVDYLKSIAELRKISGNVNVKK